MTYLQNEIAQALEAQIASYLTRSEELEKEGETQKAKEYRAQAEAVKYSLRIVKEERLREMLTQDEPEGNKVLRHIPENWTRDLDSGFWYTEGEAMDGEDAPMRLYTGNYAEYMDWIADQYIGEWDDISTIEDDLYEQCQEFRFFKSEYEVLLYLKSNYGVELGDGLVKA